MNREQNFRQVADLKQMLHESIQLFGDKTAFLQKKNKKYKDISYNQLGNDVNALGTALINLGLKNSKIAVIGENRYEWCLTYLSVVNGVGVIVPLDKELSFDELTYILNTSEASAIVYSDHYRENVIELSNMVPTLKYLIEMEAETTSDTANTTPVEVIPHAEKKLMADLSTFSIQELISSGNQLLLNNDKSYIDAEINPTDLSILLFTSGTTGFSKGVMLSHKNLCHQLVSVSTLVDAGPQDTFLSILPLHHTYENTCGFLIPLFNGSTIAFCEGLKYIAQNIKEVQPTILIVVPLILENMYVKINKETSKSRLLNIKFNVGIQLAHLLKTSFRIDITKKLFKPIHDNLGGKLRLVICGAAAIKPHVSNTFTKMGIQILQGYGLTECSPIVTGNSLRDFRHDSIGKPVPGVEVRIDTPDENDIGEILVKGDNVMLGYYNNPKATSNAFNDGWFKTGDLGKKGKGGFYYITGRIKNLIITKNGKNVFPEEIELKLNDSPFIMESIVTGTSENITSEGSIFAYIVPAIDAIKEKLNLPNLTNTDITQVIREEIHKINKSFPMFKKIQDFSIRLQEFEKTTSRKIKRHSKNIGSNSSATV